MGCAPSCDNHSTVSGVAAGAMVQYQGAGDTAEIEALADQATVGGEDKSKDLLVINSKDGDCNSFSGKMKLRLSRMTILLVFGKEDAQSEAFSKAADKGGYKYTLTKTAETALESYIANQQDLVIIDCRHSKLIDHESLCRSMKALLPKGHSRFLAVINKSEKEEPSILPLLNVGFTRRFVECTNTSSCYNELVSIERGELRAHQQLQACSAMYLALQNIAESVEVTDTKFRTEFVNSAFEKQTGYQASDVVGTEIQERLQVDNCNEEETLVYHMKKHQVWEGHQTLRRKNGDTVLCRCKVIPVEASPGKVVRHVILRTAAIQSEGQPIPSNSWDHRYETRTHEMRTFRRGSYISLSSSSEGLMHIRRRESVTRYHSMTIEAPITKVINMLNDAQASSQNNNVGQVLEKVLEILQTSDLFAPHIHQVKEEDPLTNDYVGGLCDQSSLSSQTRHGFTHKPSISSKLGSSFKIQSSKKAQSTPEVQELLENSASWNFDILKLESLTDKNALVPLGLKIFERFGATEHLEIEESVLANWLQVISANYRRENTYHNATHAADVLQATAYFLDKMRPKKLLDPQDEVAALIAAVIHDVDHPARTSSFLVNSKDKLALLYNDIAVLENHHAAMGFMLTRQNDDANILKNLDRNEYEALRHNVIDMVLATEMAKHFEHLQRFIHICKANPKNIDEDLSVKSGMSDYVLNSPENRRQILRMVIKCADVSNPARDTPVMKVWANRIAEEYFQQTDEERKRNMPVVMPNFDRATCSIPHSQLKFMEVFLMNMFEQWDSFLDIPEVATQLQNNYKYWRELDEQQTAEIAGSDT